MSIKSVVSRERSVNAATALRSGRQRARLKFDVLDDGMETHRHPQKSSLGGLEPTDHRRDCNCSQN